MTENVLAVFSLRLESGYAHFRAAYLSPHLCAVCRGALGHDTRPRVIRENQADLILNHFTCYDPCPSCGGRIEPIDNNTYLITSLNPPSAKASPRDIEIAESPEVG